jgi:hypothetical protein
MAEWDSFKIPGTEEIADLADSVSKPLKGIRTVLNLIMTIMDIAKAFLIDLGNPVKALLEALVSVIINLLNNLNQTGSVYSLMIVPGYQGQTYLDLKGGIERFKRTFSDSINDTADAQRPQFSSSSIVDTGAFFLVFDSGDAGAVFENFYKLFKAMGISIESNMPAPSNIRGYPSNKDGELIISSLDMLKQSTKPEAATIMWDTTTTTGASLLDAFIPPKWRIERDSTKEGTKLLIDETVKNANGDEVVIQRQVYDETGRPVYEYEYSEDIDTNDKTFWIGGLLTGSYQWIDKSVNPGDTWYYRIRGLIGDPQSEVIDGVQRLKNGLLGVPSSPIMVVMPPEMSDIDFSKDDPVAALLDTLYAGLILGFHLPYKTSPQFTGHGLLYEYFPWISNYLTDEKGDFFIVSRMTWAASLSDFTAHGISKSKEVFQAFWDKYKEHGNEITDLINTYGQKDESCPYLNETSIPGHNIDTFRQAVYEVLIPITGTMKLSGTPPNWTSVFRINQMIPAEVFSMIRKVEAEIRGLSEAYAGVVGDIITFIGMLENKIDALNELITYIESIIDLFKSFSFPGMYMLYIEPQGDGISGIVSALNSATGGPEPSPNNFTAGICLVFGAPLSTFFDLIAG